MKKVLNVVKTVLVVILAVLAIAMTIFTIVSVNTFNKNDRDLFGTGYRAYIVRTDSMSATDFDAGDLILVKEVDPATLKEGDIITFISQDHNSFGETITHKIRRLTTDAAGNPGFVTYGTTTGVDDETIVTYPFVMGRYEVRLPVMGQFFTFMKTPIGYFVCIFIPFMLLIVYQGIKVVLLFRKYKKEQNAQLEAEKAQIEAERQENARMLAELQALKAQMTGAAQEQSQEPPTTSPDEQ